MGIFFSPGSGSGFRIWIRIHWPDWIRIRNTAYMVEYRYRSNAVFPQLELTVHCTHCIHTLARRWAASPSHPSFNHNIDHAPARPLSFYSAGKVSVGADNLLSEYNRSFFSSKIYQSLIFYPGHLSPPTTLGNTWRKQSAPLVGACILITLIRSGFRNSNQSCFWLAGLRIRITLMWIQIQLFT